MPDKVTIFVIFYLVFLAAAPLFLCVASAKRRGAFLPFTFDPRKRDGRSVTLKFAAVAIAVIFTEPAYAANAQHLAKFLESFGVGGGVYPGREAQYIYLGVRNNRDGGVTTPDGVTNAINLHNSTMIPGVNPGVKASLLTISQPGWPTIPQFIKNAESLAAAGALLAIEGVNEPHNFGVTYNGRYGGGGATGFQSHSSHAICVRPWLLIHGLAPIQCLARPRLGRNLETMGCNGLKSPRVELIQQSKQLQVYPMERFITTLRMRTITSALSSLTLSDQIKRGWLPIRL